MSEDFETKATKIAQRLGWPVILFICWLAYPEPWLLIAGMVLTFFAAK